MVKRNKALTLIAALGLLLTASVCNAAAPRKPMPPVLITIAPSSAGITQDQIKPGDVVAFKVTATSAIDVKEMHIDVHLTRGAKLVSGETSWKGPSAKNEEKTLLLTVQAPERGTGTIRARVSVPPSDGARFSSEARFMLGPEAQAKPEHNAVKKKDSRGRNIIEYR